MASFLIGLLIGGIIGIFVMAILVAASREDDRISRYYSENE